MLLRADLQTDSRASRESVTESGNLSQRGVGGGKNIVNNLSVFLLLRFVTYKVTFQIAGWKQASITPTESHGFQPQTHTQNALPQGLHLLVCC